METAAEKYRRIKQERLDKAELHDFTSPSGMVWKLRRPDLAQFVTSGMMPMSLAKHLSEIAGDDGGAAFDRLSMDDKIRTLDFSQKVVRYCAVSPRIVETPVAPDEIGYGEVELDDFQAIFAWAMPGGEAAEGLETFRKE